MLFNKDKTVLLSYPKGKTDRSYTVPDGVRTISVEAFIDNARLSSVILPEGLTEIKYNAFCNCSRLTEISLPDGLTTVEAYAFVHCRRLKTVAVPAGVQLIDEYAFGFYHGGRMENYELARVKGFRLLYDDDVAVVKDYAQKYGIALDSKEVST